MTLTDSLASAARDVVFQSGHDVDLFFAAHTGLGFIDWFNHRLAGNPNWVNRRLGTATDVRQRFTKIWDQIPTIFGSASVSLMQFSALQCILTNEVGFNLEPLCESCGRKGFPGLAYPFSTIRGIKQTYNSAPFNRLAGDLFFSDGVFWQAPVTNPWRR